MGDRCRGSRKVGNESQIRMMLSMSLRCKNCSFFISKGSKHSMMRRRGKNIGNGGDDFIFSFRCPCCAIQLSFKTDFNSFDYVCVENVYRVSETKSYGGNSDLTSPLIL